MKTPPCRLRWHCCLLLCGVVLVPVLSTAGIVEFLFGAPELEAITVTEMTPAGLLRRSPTPENPVYFLAVSGGYIDIGGAKAGERPIVRQDVDKTVLKALAKQGYLPARADQQAEIALVWNWGTLNTIVSPLNIGSTPLNHRQMVRFLGGEKFGMGSRQNDAFPELSLSAGLERSSDLDKLVDVARDDLYIAVISAYELNLSDPGKSVRLWHTRISCPARGFWLPDAMSAMLAIASPFIGRETAKPVWIRATDKFRPSIQLGDTKLMEYIEQGEPPVIETGRSN